MAVIMKGRSINPTTVELVHESGAIVRTMAPKDNGGDGSGFSPTDLCAVSLGACAVTIMGMFARDKNIPLESIEFELKKEMGTDPRRIVRLFMQYRLKGAFSEIDFRKLAAAGKTCPVRETFKDRVIVEETYERV